MQNRLFSQALKLFVIAALLLCFIMVRFYENVLFYDPFLAYFKGDFNNMPLPEFTTFRLILSLLFRYGLNMLISLGLIYVIFKDPVMLRFSFVLYFIAFVVLIVALFLVIKIYGSNNNLLLFYIRRFIIQPVFVLLFIPAFYFQKRNS
ncbi:exosortase F-associated protein [Flavobacterium glycines]|uniref:Exosortase F system-associated protein n=1 Tax=Flavobacterium glycines TaxID=551990 RepID=A0A1B9DRF7_9FLAO|nr:exosortase F system-associated protein [Flavobacterium glycines]OCB72276.1 exosortase F system-associated protein [Flavobacterium glycines]GEL09740.1 exosortase F system-associated protein [Flavobacterium glycines]SDI95530.1 exosortase F-associated protein [Flavobacterium glycines]